MTSELLGALGGYSPGDAMSHPVDGIVFLVGAISVALLERLQFRLRARESRTWWASNGRDVLNAFALVLMICGVSVLGFRGPLGVCIAATLVLLLSALQSELDRHPHQSLWSVAAALALGAPVVWLPAQVEAAFRGMLVALF